MCTHSQDFTPISSVKSKVSGVVEIHAQVNLTQTSTAVDTSVSPAFLSPTSNSIHSHRRSFDVTPTRYRQNSWSQAPWTRRAAVESCRSRPAWEAEAAESKI